MLSLALALLAGTLCLPLLAHSLPPLPGWPLWLLVLGLLAWRPVRLAGALLLGLALFWQAADQRLADRLPPSLEGRDLVLCGRIASLPERVGRALRFRFDPVAAAPDCISIPTRLRLSWYRSDQRPRGGEIWRLRVRLKRPAGFLNPGGFDYERWLFVQDIGATGYVRRDPDNRRVGEGGGLAALRQTLYDRLAGRLGQTPGAGVLLALLLGTRQGVDDAQWARFRDTGTGHLMAISGLHVGLAAALGAGLGGWLWSRSARLCTALAAPRAALLAGLVLAAGYALLAGLSIPTRRALVMLAVLALALGAGRQVRRRDGWALALIAVLLFDPLAPLSVGFWLSFLAVGLILYLAAGRKTPRRGIRGWILGLRVPVLLALGLAPVSLLAFQQASLVGWLANLVAVPWVGVAVVPAGLAGLVLEAVGLPGGWLLGIAARAFALLDATVLAPLASLPFAAGSAAMGPPAFALAAFGTLWLLAPRGVPGRALGALMWLPLLQPATQAPPPGSAEVILADVGQGLALVVRTQRHALVYDTGPRFQSGFDTGEAVVVPLLRTLGVRALDRLVISHGDNDHIGGARSLLATMPVYSVLTSVPDRLPERPLQACRRGQAWQWDGVRFEMLHPVAGQRPGNDASCVLAITAADGSRLLLPGDIERATERALLRALPDALHAEVLVAPHHGSATSSTDAFVAAVAPEWVLYPVGYRNRYGFPRAEVRARYAAAGARALDTAQDGAIRFRLGAGAIRPQALRQTGRRLWHRAPDPAKPYDRAD